MTPEDIDRLYEAAIRRGADSVELAWLRADAMKEVGSVEEMARWMTFYDNLDAYWQELRPPSYDS